ncbi:MAG: cell division protein FtsZ [Lachnospiraceae bacterium]|nr:cell division protein FtsZ [Lachnospiraceae bacterium]
MEINLTQTESDTSKRIVVVGIGGAGNNSVSRMIDENIKGVDFIGINTNRQALQLCKAQKRILIGEKLTLGLGFGAKPEIGENAALESKEEIVSALKGADLLFVTCGMGGGTGAGAAPVIAGFARDMGILTVGVVTMPFSYESEERKENAINSLDKIKDNVDTLIVISNDKIFEIADKNTPLPQMFRKIDETLINMVREIVNITGPDSIIGIDMKDIRHALENKGLSYIGYGKGSGTDKINEAVQNAIQNPFIETSVNGAKSVIIMLDGHISLTDVDDAMNSIQPYIDEDATIILGANASTDDTDDCSITIIATGMGD